MNRALLTEPWEHPYLGRLQSRMVMTAMTRSSAGPGNVPSPAMARYYSRRAEHGIGLVITESTAIAAIGDGFPNAPRMVTPAQVEGWRQVTSAVHGFGAKIFCQLNHCGRITHPDYTDGRQPVSATDARAEGINRRNGKSYAKPRRLLTSEIPAVIETYRGSAALAILAGFDGVELHMAHGYLADQFLDARVNDRQDIYGGTIQGRCRFAMDLTAALVGDLGPARVMVRISPSRWMKGLYEWPDLHEMLAYLLPAFDNVGLRMLDISCASADYHETAGRIVRLARPVWPHQLVAGASLSPADAQAELDAGYLDMVTYGRLLIANPDLVARFRSGRDPYPFDPIMLNALE